MLKWLIKLNFSLVYSPIFTILFWGKLVNTYMLYSVALCKVDKAEGHYVHQ